MSIGEVGQHHREARWPLVSADDARKLRLPRLVVDAGTRW